MKKTLFIAMSILGISAIIGGCAGSGNNSKIPSKYKWIYGEWSSGTASFTIQEPNQIFIDDSYYGWLKFGIEEDKLHAYLAQDWLEFTLNSSNQTIMDESGDMYMKGGEIKNTSNKGSRGKTSSTERSSNSRTSTVSEIDIVGEWVFKGGKQGDMYHSQEYEEGVRFNFDGSGVYNRFVAEYAAGNFFKRHRKGGSSFTWELVGNQVYLTFNGERSPVFTYNDGKLTDMSGNVYRRQ